MDNDHIAHYYLANMQVSTDCCSKQLVAAATTEFRAMSKDVFKAIWRFYQQQQLNTVEYRFLELSVLRT